MSGWNSQFVNEEAHTFPCDERGEPADGHELARTCECGPRDMSGVVSSFWHRTPEMMLEED